MPRKVAAGAAGSGGKNAGQISPHWYSKVRRHLSGGLSFMDRYGRSCIKDEKKLYVRSAKKSICNFPEKIRAASGSRPDGTAGT